MVVVLIIGLAAADYWSVLPRPGTFNSPVHVVETPQTVPATVTTSPAIETVARADLKPAHVEAARADPSTQVANRGERAESAQRGQSQSGHAHKLARRPKDEPAQSAQTIQKPVAYANRKLARRLNQEGLSLFQERHYADAAAVFAKAREAYPADAEITENLGYSLLRAGDLAAAERALLSALELAPQRATAWGSLSHIYAKRGQHREAVALLLTAYRFSSNPKKTMEVYARQAESEDDPKVRAMLAESVALLSSVH